MVGLVRKREFAIAVDTCLYTCQYKFRVPTKIPKKSNVATGQISATAT